MNIFLDVVLILGAYILGSAPQLSGLARLRRVKLSGDYHMSLFQKAGIYFFGLGVILEFIKGAIPVLVGKWLGFDLYIVAITGVAVVCGQMWPVFHRFDGEKGNTTLVGMAPALAYQPMMFAVIPIAIGAGIRTGSRLFRRSGQNKNKPLFGGPYSRSLPLGMLTGFLVLPVASWVQNQPPEVTWAFGIVFVLILVRRLTAGLSRDLQAGAGIKKIVLGRLFLDRGATPFRT
ncbi:MAG: Glycerol-3-phosphate acyltransferase [Chloroflexi bacterium]|nr:Glycerol-3-phosphate acyltransferase [Chloroflexota bacterium]